MKDLLLPYLPAVGLVVMGVIMLILDPAIELKIIGWVLAGGGMFYAGWLTNKR